MIIAVRYLCQNSIIVLAHCALHLHRGQFPKENHNGIDTARRPSALAEALSTLLYSPACSSTDTEVGSDVVDGQYGRVKRRRFIFGVHRNPQDCSGCSCAGGSVSLRACRSQPYRANVDLEERIAVRGQVSLCFT